MLSPVNLGRLSGGSLAGEELFVSVSRSLLDILDLYINIIFSLSGFFL
jgi:hypothetical protein